MIGGGLDGHHGHVRTAILLPEKISDHLLGDTHLRTRNPTPLLPSVVQETQQSSMLKGIELLDQSRNQPLNQLAFRWV
jgi:hypothetical protein